MQSDTALCNGLIPREYTQLTGADLAFWLGGQRSFDPWGAEPIICLKLPENCMNLKTSWGPPLGSASG